MNKPRWVLMVGLCLVLSSRRYLLSAENADQCWTRITGAGFVANLVDIAMTGDSLRLLNGNEDPRLRRVLEFRLITAIEDAKRRIEDSPVVEAIAMPSLIEGLRKAKDYLDGHPLNVEVHNSMVSSAKALEHLERVRAWVAKQPWGASANGS